MFTLDTIAKFLRIFSSVILSFMAVAMVLIIWRGGWEQTLQGEQLRYLGIISIILISMMGFSLFFTTDRIKHFEIEKGDFKASINGDEGTNKDA